MAEKNGSAYREALERLTAVYRGTDRVSAEVKHARVVLGWDKNDGGSSPPVEDLVDATEGEASGLG
jgi:hypothetical protein